MLTLRAARSARSILAIGLIAASASSSAAEQPPQAKDDAIDRLVAQVCDKQLVMLGEDARHGSGATLKAKAEIVRRLVETCGFDAVYFESQLYDFLDLEAALRAGRATPEMLADAIGGFWSTTAELQPLIAFLFDKASRTRLDLQGLDPQLGGATQRYSQERLASELAAWLDESQREACRAGMARFASWTFDATTPFDEAFRNRVAECASHVREAAIGDPAPGAAAAARMADSVRVAIAVAARAGPDVREQAMFDNFTWLASRRTPAPRVVVWCATVHALRRPPATRIGIHPLGARLAPIYGDRLASIGFSAGSGAFAPPRSAPTAIEPAPAGSLEARVLAARSEASVFVGREELVALGRVASGTLSYARWRTEDWGSLLDGVLVLREERPPTYLRPPRPLQPAAR